MDAATEKKKPGTAFPQNPTAQSTYGRGAPGAQPVPTPALPARNTAFPQNAPTRSIYSAPQGNTGVGALVDSIFAPKAQEAAPTPTPAVAGMASRPLVASAAGGALAAAQSAPAYSNEGKNVPAPRDAPSLNAPWWSREYAQAANASELGGLELEQQRARNPAAASIPSNDPVRRIMETGTVASGAPAVARAAVPSAPATTAQNPLRVQEARLGVQSPGNAQAAGAPGQKGAPITSLGQGQDVGFGVTRFDVPGQSPLFTNKTDAAGMVDNLKLMNRGSVSAQNEAAAQAMSDRGAQERANVRNNEAVRQQYAAEVAQANAINKASSETSARISREMDFKKRDRELDVAAGSIRNSPQERAAIEQRRAALRTEFEGGNLSREKMTAEQAANQARLVVDQQRVGIEQQRAGTEQQRAGTEQQRVNNDVATGAQTREARGMEISAARQLAGLQAQYMEATDPKVKQQLARQLATLSGKYEGGMKPQVIRGADMLGDGGQVIRGGERLIGVDPETGQVMDLTPGGAAAAKPSGQQGGFVQGMAYKDPVSGEFAEWNGSTFVPIKSQK